jgi:hypothetical protein
VDCVRNPDRSKEEPIDPAMIKRMKSASHHAKAQEPWTADEIRWYKFFFILFPLMVPPRSPCKFEYPPVRAELDITILIKT